MRRPSFASLQGGERSGSERDCYNRRSRRIRAPNGLVRAISSISHVGWSAALLGDGVAVATTSAAGQKIARRHPLGGGGSARVRREEMQCTALCRRRVGHQTGRDHDRQQQEASHGSVLGCLQSRTIPIQFHCDKSSGSAGAEKESNSGASGRSVPQKDHGDSTRQSCPSGLSRAGTLCSAHNEMHSLSIRTRCSFFVASVLARVGNKDL